MKKNIFYFSSLLSLLTQYKLCTAEKEWAMTIVPKVLNNVFLFISLTILGIESI